VITGSVPVTFVKPITEQSVIHAGDYLNKLSGEQIEYECKRRIEAGCKEIVVNFAETELVNSIGISILLGVIDTASSNGATVVFSDVNENTIELFEMLGLTKHVTIAKATHNSQTYGRT
jgi:anti-anti-sigma factor